MLLQPINPKPPLNSRHQTHHNHVHLISNSFSFSSELVQSSTFYLRQPIISINNKTHKNSGLISCSSISQVHSNGSMDFEKRPMLKWNAVYRKISSMENPHMGSGSVLNEVENKGKMLSKWELSRVVKELRKFKRFKYALEVHEWMNNRPERYRVTTSDTAIQLDLIAKVHGISSAEQYFSKLPDALKDKRVYGSLLNAYVRAKMKEKAESLMDKLRNRGYANHPLPFNVMMTLYMNLKDHAMIESLISEMREKEIALDLYSYNIWLSSRGSEGSLKKMEQVFEQMQMDPTINPNWTTFSTMATMYIKLGEFVKAQECLKKIESRITGQDRTPYHYLISLYGGIGNKEEVYRVWNIYKANFVIIPNLGYHTIVSALIRLDDMAGAEKIYDEWLLVKQIYDPRVGNLLLSSYVRKGLSKKAETFFDQMIEGGGKPNSMTWEIFAENHIRNRRIPEALSCLKNAASTEGMKSWRPKPTNVSLILGICEQEGDVLSKDALFSILRHLGCLDDVGYMSYIPISGGGTLTDTEPEVDVADVILSQLQSSL